MAMARARASARASASGVEQRHIKTMNWDAVEFKVGLTVEGRTEG